MCRCFDIECSQSRGSRLSRTILSSASPAVWVTITNLSYSKCLSQLKNLSKISCAYYIRLLRVQLNYVAIRQRTVIPYHVGPTSEFLYFTSWGPIYGYQIYWTTNWKVWVAMLQALISQTSSKAQSQSGANKCTAVNLMTCRRRRSTELLRSLGPTKHLYECISAGGGQFEHDMNSIQRPKYFAHIWNCGCRPYCTNAFHTFNIYFLDSYLMTLLLLNHCLTAW